MKKVIFVAAVCAAFGFNSALADTTTVANNEMAVAKDLTVKAAYVKEEGGVKTYKVTLADADDKTLDVLFNEKGEALPAENQE